MAQRTGWSAELQALTREHLRQKTFEMSPDGVALKHADGAFGVMALADAVNGTWQIRERKDGTVHRFRSLDDLIAAGWVLD